MGYIIKKPIPFQHTCELPPWYKVGVGSVWRCDGVRSAFLGRLLRPGCGKHYQLKDTKEWVEVSWPPSPPKGRASSSDAASK